MSGPDVAVVGAGVIGLGIAWRCAQRGARVTVYDPTPGAGASDVAAGMLAPVTEATFGEEPLLRLGLDSARRWPDFAEELAAASGEELGHRTDGTVLVGYTEDDLREIERLHRFYGTLGLPAQRLTARECRARVPLLAPRIRGGMFAAGDHQVDPRRVSRALLRAAVAAGVTVVERRVERLADLDTERVVLAAGSWSPYLAEVPVRPVKGQVLRLRVPGGVPGFAVNVRALSNARSVYLVPRTDGEVVVGATMEERGYDVSVTGGGVHDLLRAAIDVLPETAEYELVETRAGLRPGTPDNAPLLGALDSRLVLATGHHRAGILLLPTTADAIAELLATGAAPERIAPFDPLRFTASADEAGGDSDGGDSGSGGSDGGGSGGVAASSGDEAGATGDVAEAGATGDVAEAGAAGGGDTGGGRVAREEVAG